MTAEHIARIALHALASFDLGKLWQVVRLMEWLGGF
jgi:hypothetical protein